jgi:Ca2+/Na+ antiporter
MHLKNEIMTVFQDDIGVSGVIGSAVFNITLVIAVCALSATEELHITDST